MARKNLLTESELRRFMKLAEMRPLGEEKIQEMYGGSMPGARDEEEGEMDMDMDMPVMIIDTDMIDMETPSFTEMKPVPAPFPVTDLFPVFRINSPS